MSAALLLAAVAPGIISTQAFAAQVTARSIALTSSSIGATDVSYDVAFTSVGAAGAFAIDFCTESPDPADDCTAPAGFTAAAVDTQTPDFTAAVDSTDVNRVIVTGDIDPATAITVRLDGITNPTVAESVYARIATYANPTNAGTATSPIDQGSVVIGITNTIAVSGAVLESLTFCVAKATITKDCANAAANLPVLALGEEVSPGVKALRPGDISTASLFTQLSTNASTGAVITLKSSTACGGMKRNGVSTCDILPALKTGFAAGEAKFGVKTATASGTDGTAFGTLIPVAATGYNDTTYFFNYLADNSSGVTSPLGDPFLTTNNLPASNQNMQLTFGASVSPQTPAGNYSTSLNMIATGKF